ncbi:MAG TPA: glutamate--tRNA ligase [Bacteroidales bacterium]|nr:MAG: glutamate--tRNA ligase [Bacteroidetes bacterium GWF2_33_38]OFY92002.1 MAG: glutamate--tRNA ligase [Bacteroidetes bacterium RIFOXYA2_FULL_33_7]HBF89500.1 glutamate--tRNA ligase [Bacteroidales bacterium]
MSRRVRVRFAPSPTGPLHMGGVRTALFNYLFAKKHGGDFLLRIEDTDQTRYVPGAEEYIIEALKWCNIPFDEGVGIGGNCGPYRQSERKPIYKKYADELIANGWAYYAFDTPEELDAMRKKLEEEKSSTLQYDAITRKMMRNSITISKEETEKLLNEGVQYVIRFKMPDNEELKMTDLIRGEVIVNTRTLDDKVLFKSDGMPTYHLANVVDDYLMDISHVIRGEEWLPSMPLHVMLYRAFGWTDKMPQFSHLPLLLKPDGKGKLSKRDGDRLGFPVFPLQWTSPEGEISSGYRESGYFADAFVNLLALLGWNSGTEQEIFTKEELVELFSLERVGKSGSKFDPEKAKWFNHQYLRTKSNEELAKLYLPILETKNIQVSEEFVVKVIALIKDRATFVKDFWEHSSFLFEAPTTYDEAVIKKRWKEDVPDALKKIIAIIILHSTDDIQKLHDKVMEFIQANELNMGQIMNCFRLCLVGGSKGPDLFEMIGLLGEREVVTRLEKALDTIKI